jgi:hypothetical protein
MNLKSLLEAVHIDLHLSLEKFGFQQTSVAEPNLGKYHIRNVSFKKNDYMVFITLLFDKNKNIKNNENIENKKDSDIDNGIFINISLMKFKDNNEKSLEKNIEKNIEKSLEKDVIITDHFYVDSYDYKFLEQKISNVLNSYYSMCLNKEHK